MYKRCPLCKSDLTETDYGTFIISLCKNCMVDDMPKFSVTYDEEYDEIETVWWIKDYYIQVFHTSSRTTVSRIDYCILLDSVRLNHILQIDPENPLKVAERLDKLMIFS